MFRSLLILSFVSYVTGSCVLGSERLLETGQNAIVPIGEDGYAWIPRTQDNCGHHSSNRLRNSIYPLGCFQQTWHGVVTIYYNLIGGSCTSGLPCRQKCEKVGCTLETSDNYDPTATYYDGVCQATKGVVKTCTSSSSFCSWLDNDALNNEYYVILKHPHSNCAIEPDVNGTVDLSVLDTQGKPMYIGAYAFEDCTELKSIVLPSSLERIGHFVFVDTGLTEVTVPNSVKYIGEYGIRLLGESTVNLPVGNIAEIADTYRALTSSNIYNVRTIRGCKLLSARVTEDICPLGCTYSNYAEYDSSAVLYDGSSCATLNPVGIHETDCDALESAFETQKCCSD